MDIDGTATLGYLLTRTATSLRGKVAARLEQEGLISRPENADHGRSLPARLTRRGTTQLEKAAEAVTAAENEVMEKLTADERRALKAMLAKCVPSQLP